jgi:hypothetical protein
LAVISSIISSSSEEFRQVVFDQQGASEYAQYLSHRPAKLEVVLDNCNEAVCDDGDVNLYPDSILGITPERLDSEMLLDPFEEKLDLSTVTVEQGDVLCSEIKVIGIVHKRASEVFCIIDNPAQFCRIISNVVFASKPDCLVDEYTVLSVEQVFTTNNLKLRFPFLPDD